MITARRTEVRNMKKQADSGFGVIPLVSVITVTKNAERYLEQTILSVISQTYPRIEYLIFDGQSEDGTHGIINKYRERIDVFVSEADASMYDAINKAIQKSSGDIIAILNADDRYADADTVSDVVDAIARLDVDGVYGDLIIDYGSGCTYKKVFQVTHRSYLLSGKGTFVPHVGLFLKRSCIYAAGLYDTRFRYAADYDFILRCLSLCKIRYIPRPIAYFRRHPQSITASGVIGDERNKILRVHGYHDSPRIFVLVAKCYLWTKYYLLNAVRRVSEVIVRR